MSTQHCTLCELETPNPPVTEEKVDGVFCCTGCLHVYKLLEDMDTERAEELRRQTIQLRQREQGQPALPESYQEAFFRVDGMHCATCESFIEAIANRQEGIYKSEASYASEMVKIYYDADRLTPDEVPPVLSRMGYSLQDVEDQNPKNDSDEVVGLIIGGFFGIIGLLLYSLFLYPTYIGDGFIPLTETEKLFFVSNIGVMTSFVLFYTGFPILRGAWVSLSVLKPNMDLLIAIAAVSAYLYSVGALLTGSSEVYFDVTMAIVLVVSIGNHYEKRIKAGKRDLLASLAEKKPDYAHIRKNGKLQQIPISNIKPGDNVLVKAGEHIPIDGTIVDGKGVVNEALMTGESIPVAKKPGDHVVSGTILTQNALTIEAGEDSRSTINELIKLMWNIQSSRPGKQRLADRIATYFVPGVIILGIATFVYHLVAGGTPANAMLSALAVLIVSCPCALGLATPLAIASGIRSALKNDIIFKSSAVFEGSRDCDIIAFDKTGTLTTGNMHLLDEGSDQRALQYAAALERYSSHPIAEPIANTNQTNNFEVEHLQTHAAGIQGVINGVTVLVGKPEWLNHQEFTITPDLDTKIRESRSNGNVPVAVGWEGKVHSILIVGDHLRIEAESVVSDLQKRNKKIALITGDSQEAGNALQKQLHPDFLFTEARPESKSNIIKELRQLGTVAMAGDGSNDAPALAEADLGIAFGDPTAIAADSAQIVIPSDKLKLIPAAFKAIKLTKNRIRQNIGWAFLYNIVTIPLAIAGAINPLFAAVAMATSSLLVVSNSSRKMPLTAST